MHQSTEMAHREDIENCIALLTAGIEGLGGYDWDFGLAHGQGPDAHPDAGTSDGDFDWVA